MSEKELSDLRKKVELLEAALKKAAGDWDDIGDRMDGAGEWIEEITIKDGEERLVSLERQLEEEPIWFIKKDIMELEKKVSELSERTDAEILATRKEAAELSSEHGDRQSDIREELVKLIEELAEEIAGFAVKLEIEAAHVLGQEKDLRREFKVMLKGLASDADVAGAFRVQERRHEEQINSLQQQLNAVHSQISQLQQAISRPSLVDQFLGCMIGLALVAGFIWLAVKLFYWVMGLIR